MSMAARDIEVVARLAASSKRRKPTCDRRLSLVA
jgi:hypothetical protein